jgi:hypothetical protein
LQIDRLNLEGYANLDHWVAELDKRIEGILLQRLTTIIHVWCAEFDRTEDDVRRDTTVTMKRRGERRKDEKVRRLCVTLLYDADGAPQTVEGGLALKPIVHEIRIQNQVIFLDPPIEYARQTWIQQLHEWLGAREAPSGAASREADARRRRRVPAPAHPELAVRNRPADAGHGHDRGELHVPGACDARRLASRAC